MKKTLLLGLLALGGFTANAQIQNGSQAPDFTVTDMNGASHNLYTYLNAGKTVILDISATWCGPCWGYHGSDALANLYNTYGPGGSDEVVVLFVEGDPATTVADMYGTGTNTQGNWMEHSPYPMINDANISTIFNLEHFPSIIRICPDKVITEIGQQNLSSLKNSINACEGNEPLVGKASHGVVTTTDQALCAAPATLNMQAKLKNFGNNPITAATIVLKENGNVVATKNYAGNLNPNGSATITYNDVAFNATANYEVQVVDINGVAQTAATAMHDLHVDVAVPTNNIIQVKIHTGSYPAEMTWNIKGSGGNIVAEGGPYQGTANGAAGGPDANSEFTETITLPEGTDCYKIQLNDLYGDGWTFGSQQGIQILSGDGNAVVFDGMNPGNFGSAITYNGAFTSNGIMGVSAVESAGFAIYPNPSTGIFNFATQEPVDVMVLDLTGKVVYTAKGIQNDGSINLSALQKGMYIAKVNGANSERVEKIVIE